MTRRPTFTIYEEKRQRPLKNELKKQYGVTETRQVAWNIGVGLAGVAAGLLLLGMGVLMLGLTIALLR